MMSHQVYFKSPLQVSPNHHRPNT